MPTPSEIKAHLQRDAKLAPIVEELPFPVFDPHRKVFTSLLSSIISQQLSVKAAATIHGRFLDLFPDQQPTAEHLMQLSTEDLRGAGLSRQKSSYIYNVAEFFAQENLMNESYEGWTDEEIVKKLIQIKGVGKWTVEMVLMFTLHRPDVLPVDDLGIQQAFEKLYNLDLSQKKKVLHEQMFKIAEPWKPYRTYASTYLWRFKDKD